MKDIKYIFFVILILSPFSFAVNELAIYDTNLEHTAKGLKYSYDWGEANITLEKLDNITIRPVAYSVVNRSSCRNVNINKLDKEVCNNITIYKNETFYNYSKITNNLFIDQKSYTKYKYGANVPIVRKDNTTNMTRLYKYSINSSSRLIMVLKHHLDEKTNIIYKVPTFYTYQKISAWNESRLYYDFSDVCTKPGSNCFYEYNTTGTGAVYFYSNGSIDPVVNGGFGCSTLDQNDTYYILDGNKASAGDCITIIGHNITFDLNTFTLDGDGNHPLDEGINTGYGYAVNITIKNGRVKDFGKNINHVGDNFYIDDMTLTGTVSYVGSGFSYYMLGNNNVINNSNISYYKNTAGASAFAWGLLIYNSVNASVYNSDINNITGTSYGHGIALFQYSDHFFIKDSRVKGKTLDMRLWAGCHNLTALNTTYATEYFFTVGCPSLNRLWYYRAVVNNTWGAPIENANVTIENVNASGSFSLLTNNSGFTETIFLKEYDYNCYASGDKYNYSTPHNITVSAENYTDKLQVFNSTKETNNIFHLFTLSIAIPSANTNLGPMAIYTFFGLAFFMLLIARRDDDIVLITCSAIIIMFTAFGIIATGVYYHAGDLEINTGDNSTTYMNYLPTSSFNSNYIGITLLLLSLYLYIKAGVMAHENKKSTG